MASAMGPIADLSYRNYDGPMEDVGKRWWVIAKMFMRLSVKKKGFWIWAAFSTYGYFILSIIFYFIDTLHDAGTFGRGQPNLMTQIVWKQQVYVGFSLSQIWLFVVTLLIGAGAVAADNRANALLVYLSKPVSKAEYLFGKWLGMFLLILAVTGIPLLIFTAFTWISYRQYGTWDSWLLIKALFMMPIPAALHASIMLGVSSLFNQARLAGATYAGIYFITSFIAFMGERIRESLMDDGRGVPHMVGQMSYFSVDGMINGLAKVVLDTSGAVPFIMSRRGVPTQMLLPPPSPALFITIYVAICAISIAVAWRKVRAVEVVG